MNKSVLFTVKTGAAFLSTSNPVGGLLYFTFLGVEKGAEEQGKIIREQGGVIYPNQNFPYQIVPGLGPAPQIRIGRKDK